MLMDFAALKEFSKFPDHYTYSIKDISKIKEFSKKNNLTIITTEKDFLRLNNSEKENIKYIKIKLKVIEEKKFIECINQYL